MYDPNQRANDERHRRVIEKRRAKQVRADVQEVMALPAMRRLLAQFFDDMGLDAPGYRALATDIAYVAGLRDGAAWWMTAMRDHCPEREPMMRAEARRDAKELQDLLNESDEDTDLHEHD